MEYKHIQFSNLQGIGWALEQVDSSYKLMDVLTVSPYEGIAVFGKELVLTVENPSKPVLNLPTLKQEDNGGRV